MKSAIRMAILSALLLSICIAQEAPTVAVQVYESREKAFSSEVTKADAELDKAREQRDKAVAAAANARLQQYQEKLKEVTKSGDFDKAAGLASEPWTMEELLTAAMAA